MYSRIFIGLTGLLFVTSIPRALAQEKVEVIGIVLDAVTLEPLPYAHIVRNHRAATTPNHNGSFMLNMSQFDTLTISHVSYISQSLLINKPEHSDTLTLAIFLESEIKLLPELSISPYPATVKQLKQEIMKLEVIDPVQSLRDQQSDITYDIIMSPKVSFDSYENFRRIGQPTEFILFSTGPNKGIGKLLRTLGISKKYRK